MSSFRTTPHATTTTPPTTTPGLWQYLDVFFENSRANKINKLQRRACKFILWHEYTNLEEARNRLKMLSFSENLFLQKAKVMYKVANRTASEYLTDLFQMRNVNINDTLSTCDPL